MTATTLRPSTPRSPKPAAQSERPTLIVLRTIIADPAPTKRNTSEAHGAPLGKEEIAKTKAILGWPPDPFHVAPQAYTEMQPLIASGDPARGRVGSAGWRTTRTPAPSAHRLEGKLPAGWDAALPDLSKESLASRQASQKALAALAASVPGHRGRFGRPRRQQRHQHQRRRRLLAHRHAGPRIHWGVREHGMAAAMNGMAAHGGIRPYGATFLIFLDYCKPAVRLAALMKLAPIYIFTHDSIGLGEDGPTHQPIEQLAMLRGIPGMVMLRPADSAETVEAWRAAISHTTARPP